MIAHLEGDVLDVGRRGRCALHDGLDVLHSCNGAAADRGRRNSSGVDEFGMQVDCEVLVIVRIAVGKAPDTDGFNVRDRF